MKLKPTQLLLDVLMTDGHPSVAPAIIPQPHLPILACNMDLQWMAEAPMVGWIQNFERGKLGKGSKTRVTGIVRKGGGTPPFR